MPDSLSFISGHQILCKRVETYRPIRQLLLESTRFWYQKIWYTHWLKIVKKLKMFWTIWISHCVSSDLRLVIPIWYLRTFHLDKQILWLSYLENQKGLPLLQDHIWKESFNTWEEANVIPLYICKNCKDDLLKI
jgi:hypothetical protein